MNDREKAIGARLREFREALRLSQREFANLVGISSDQLASVEYGRTPLRYKTAWQIRDTVGLSVEYLAGGDMGPEDVFEDASLPRPGDPKVPETALLTEIFCKYYRLDGVPYKPKLGNDIKLGREKMGRRADGEWILELKLERWLAEIPDAYVDEFCQSIARLAQKLVKDSPAEPSDIVEARIRVLRLEKMRRRFARIQPKEESQSSAPEKSDLTDVSLKSKSGDVKSELQKLIAQVRKLASKPGAKSELARFLGVAPARITEWLHEDPKLSKEPGGEYTLLLLKWVRQNQGQ